MYHPGTATFYSYYWGGSNERWTKNPTDIDVNDTKPGTIIPLTKEDYDQEIHKLKAERKMIDSKIKKVKLKRDQK